MPRMPLTLLEYSQKETLVMPSRLKDEVFREIIKEELEGSPWKTVHEYNKALGASIDLKIKGFVVDLMNLGYPTETSCAGGPGHITKAGGMGFVWINQDLAPEEKREIKKLARKYRLTGLRFESQGGMSQIVFNPVGGKPLGH